MILHANSSLDCWCSPTLYIACDVCGPHVCGALHTDELRSIRTSTCWKCDGGLHRGLLLSDRTTALLAHGCVVVHNDAAEC